MISAVNYMVGKGAGTAILSKVGSSYAIEWKKFNPLTGVELFPEVEAMGMDQVESEIVTVTAQLAALNVLKTDMEALG